MSKPRLPDSGGTRLRLLGNNQAHLCTLGTLHSQFTPSSPLILKAVLAGRQDGVSISFYT